MPPPFYEGFEPSLPPPLFFFSWLLLSWPCVLAATGHILYLDMQYFVFREQGKNCMLEQKCYSKLLVRFPWKHRLTLLSEVTLMRLLCALPSKLLQIQAIEVTNGELGYVRTKTKSRTVSARKALTNWPECRGTYQSSQQVDRLRELGWFILTKTRYCYDYWIKGLEKTFWLFSKLDVLQLSLTILKDSLMLL